MEWTPFTTRCLIVATFLVYVVLDVLFASGISNEATFSKQMQWIGMAWPIVIVAYGGLGAHFFVAKYDVWPGWWVVLKPALCLFIGFAAFCVAWQQTAPGR